jgi:iron complex outermembrane receptor protein
MKYKNLQFLYNTHFSQKIPPYSMSTMAKSYDHDKYMQLNGFSPSFSSKSHHSDLSYSRSLGKVNLKGTVTYDNSELSHYQIVTDFPFPELGSYYGIPDSLNFFNYPGIFRFLSADEKNYGVTLKGDYSYIESKNHKGSISFGAEWSQFSVDNVRYALGYNFTTLNRENSFITDSGKGRENSYNAFLQLKHQWRSVILNAGLRYDHKERADNEVLREYSPRVAFIFLQPKWNIKLSYSRSFVDAPYMYRKINELLPILVGNVSSKTDLVFTSLDPEFVNSVQITFAGINWIKGLSFELNGFYNVAKNLIETHVISHENRGTNKMGGLEFQAQYRSKRFTGDFNLTWTHTFKSNVFTEDIDDNNNIPTIMSNAVLAWQVTPRLKLHSHIMFEGVQRTYNLDVVEMLRFLKFADSMTEVSLDDPAFWDQYKLLASKLIMNKRIPSRVIFNLGAEYKIDKFTFGINVHNLFDKYYYRSGMNTNIVPQRGRWFMFDIAYKI